MAFTSQSGAGSHIYGGSTDIIPKGLEKYSDKNNSRYAHCILCCNQQNQR